jgi:ABC-2 type transport system permease protein
MRNIVRVIKHEIIVTISKPIFWVTTFLLPIIIMVFTVGAQIISIRTLTEDPDLTDVGVDQDQSLVVGYIDDAGIIKNIPDSIPDERIKRFTDETSAHLALNAGKVSQYFVIEDDYLSTGDLLVVSQEFSPLGEIQTYNVIQDIIIHNMVNDKTIAHLVGDPIFALETYKLDPSGIIADDSQDDATRYILGFGVLFIFFMILTMSSSFMLRSVSTEKENQTVEVLLVSLHPRELMFGKITGLGIVAVLQMVIWFLGSSLVVKQDNTILTNLGIFLTQGLSLPKGFMFWALIYLVLGYILYASILGAIGALAPNMRETGQFTFLAMFPLMLPMWLNTLFVQSPNGEVATLLSLFPLTAPTAMLPRIASGGVPTWQIIFSALGLAIATYLFLTIAARFFRADTLLSTQSLSLKRFRNEIVNALQLNQKG